eukprot:4009944-Pyramimonas_sp.AAC.1
MGVPVVSPRRPILPGSSMWRPSSTKSHAWPKPVLSVAAWITACARPQSSGNRAQPGGGGPR